MHLLPAIRRCGKFWRCSTQSAPQKLSELARKPQRTVEMVPQIVRDRSFNDSRDSRAHDARTLKEEDKPFAVNVIRIEGNDFFSSVTREDANL
jgi:hypothetical protein